MNKKEFKWRGVVVPVTVAILAFAFAIAVVATDSAAILVTSLFTFAVIGAVTGVFITKRK